MTHTAENDALGICAPMCPECGWQAVARLDDQEGREAAKADVVAHKAVCPGAQKCRACAEGAPIEIAACTCPIPPGSTTKPLMQYGGLA